VRKRAFAGFLLWNGARPADGKARTNILRDLCAFIGRMAQQGAQVALWFRTFRQLNGEPLEDYLTRQSEAPVRQFQAGTAQQIGAFALPVLLPNYIAHWNLSKTEAGWLVGISSPSMS
jgi:hypothetical protein